MHQSFVQPLLTRAVSLLFAPSPCRLAGRFQAYGFVFQFLASKPWGRDLLLRYPELFSNGMFTREGPSEQQMQATTFSFTAFASGYSTGACDAGKQPYQHSTACT
jgi:hypothetical protein